MKPTSASTFTDTVTLNSVEAFHALSGTALHPNVVVGRFEYQGVVDEKLAKEAWRICLSRQVLPLRTASHDGLKWQLDGSKNTSGGAVADESFSVIDIDQWSSNPLERKVANLNELGIPDLHLGASPAFALCCLRSEKANRSEVVFAAHHALVDGLAGISFMRQWMQCYDNLCRGLRPDKGLPGLDFERYLKRGELGLLSWNYLKLLPLQAVGLFGATKFVLRKFYVLDKSISTVVNSINSPGIIGKDIDTASCLRLRELAEQHAVSENSIVIATLFRILDGARISGRFKASNSSWLRLILPMNVREFADRRIPCTNRTSLVQIDRRRCKEADIFELARNIAREIGIIANWKLDRIFLIALRIASVSGSLLRKVAQNEKPRGTAVFANLGEPLRPNRHCDFVHVGGLVRESFDMSGPIRAGTPLNFSWQKHRAIDGRFVGRVTLHFDQSVISEQDAHWLLEQFEIV